MCRPVELARSSMETGPSLRIRHCGSASFFRWNRVFGSTCRRSTTFAWPVAPCRRKSRPGYGSFRWKLRKACYGGGVGWEWGTSNSATLTVPECVGFAMGVALHGKVAMPRLLGYWVIRPIVPESACVSVRGCNGVFDIQALVPSRARSCSLLQFGNRLHDAYKIPVVASLQ